MSPSAPLLTVFRANAAFSLRKTKVVQRQKWQNTNVNGIWFCFENSFFFIDKEIKRFGISKWKMRYFHSDIIRNNTQLNFIYIAILKTVFLQQETIKKFTKRTQNAWSVGCSGGHTLSHCSFVLLVWYMICSYEANWGIGTKKGMTEAKNREERKPRANRQKLKYEVKDWPREQSDRTAATISNYNQYLWWEPLRHQAAGPTEWSQR